MLIENFSVVAVGIYRGRQPRNNAEWDELIALPIVQSVKLDREQPSESDEYARQRGVEITYAPESFLQQLITGPSIEEIETIVAFMDPRGTYIHCLHGEDRTGLIVAAYRIIHCGWSRDDAWKEMITHKFHPFLGGLTKVFNHIADKYKA